MYTRRVPDTYIILDLYYLFTQYISDAYQMYTGCILDLKFSNFKYFIMFFSDIKLS